MQKNRNFVKISSKVAGNKKSVLVGLVVLLCLLVKVYFELYEEASGQKGSELEIIQNNNVYFSLPHEQIVSEFYEKRKAWKTSNLGSILFKNVSQRELGIQEQKNSTFVVLVWKYYGWLSHRHIKGFHPKRSKTVSDCKAKNCKFVGDNRYMDSADAVVVHLQHGDMPTVTKRNVHQRWIFMSDESPENTFTLSPVKKTVSMFADVFNWSMTYRTDSDIPVPYGRVVPLNKAQLIDTNYESLASIVPNWKRKRRDVLVAILMSNCRFERRMKFLKELQQHIDVDVHGKCSENMKDSCPGHFQSDCEPMSDYLFYLVLENSKCRQYLSEKSFYHAYSKGAIPIIMGPPLQDCELLLPPFSFLHISNYKSVRELAEEIYKLSRNEKEMLSYHKWRNNFEVIQEHGYFGSKSSHYCRVCEALNFNSKAVSVYDHKKLRLFLDPKLLCT